MLIDVSLTTPMKTGPLYGSLKTDEIEENSKRHDSQSTSLIKLEEGYLICLSFLF